MRFFRRPQQLQIVRRISSDISIEEWRSNKELVLLARKFLNNPDFRMMTDTLRNSAPHNYVSLKEMSIDARAMEQARIEGFQLCLNNLAALGMETKKAVELEPDFSQPEEFAPK